MRKNTLYYGDNLHVLRTHLQDESVDLVYLDPPFNSGRDYNAVFEDGEKGTAQVKAFTDTWKWDDVAHAAYEEIVRDTSGEPLRIKLAETMKAFRVVLGTGSTLAYLSMMAPRLVELRRVLKPTGSLYLHCDPTASHYLKMLLDGIMGRENFRNEIVWKRTSAHNDATTGFGSITDCILYYARSQDTRFNVVRVPLDPVYVAEAYKHTDPDGRRYQLDNTSAPAGGGMAAINKTTGRPNGWYEWKGYQPPARGWRYSPETMQRLHDEGKLHYPADKSQRIRLKRYLDTNEGQAASNLWADIPPLQRGSESLGYPTQKPRALLERIIKASTNEGDTVLDPFCGCGTALDASVVLKRNWIGIDITHLAVGVIKKRMGDVHNLFPGKGKDYTVVGEPADLAGAQQLADDDPHQFQTWALGLVGARTDAGPAKKGGDKGIDGIKVFSTSSGETVQCLISVKGGQAISSGMIRDLRGTLEREKAAMGLLITLKPPTSGMKQEAREAGTYEPEGLDALLGAEIPRIQIASVEDLLAGRVPLFPTGVSTTDRTIKKGKRQGT